MASKSQTNNFNQPGKFGSAFSQRRSLKQDSSVFESIKELGKGTGKTITNDLIAEGSRDFMRQLLGMEQPKINASGNIPKGEPIYIDKVVEEERAENKILKSRLIQEQRLREADRVVVDEKGQNLKLELQALTQEVQKLAESTVELSEKTKIAAMQAPANAGIYHVNFFEKLLSFIKAFRKKIENASIWIHSQNQRASKKHGFWGQVQKGGAKRLLSMEDYAPTRSQG